MVTLPNGKPIDMDMLETAMEDSDLANKYFLNLVTGKVLFFSEYVGFSNEDEHLLQKSTRATTMLPLSASPPMKLTSGWSILSTKSSHPKTKTVPKNYPLH